MGLAAELLLEEVEIMVELIELVEELVDLVELVVEVVEPMGEVEVEPGSTGLEQSVVENRQPGELQKLWNNYRHGNSAYNYLQDIG